MAHPEAQPSAANAPVADASANNTPATDGTAPGPGARERRDFALVLTGQTVSAFGDAFSNVAMPLLILAVTGSVSQMGFVVALSTVSQLAGSVVAGAVADRVDRRRLLILCDVVQLALGASLPVAWWLSPAGTWPDVAPWVIYPVVATSSVLYSVYRVTFRATIPQLFGRERLLTVNGRLTMGTEIGYGLGPALAGLAVAAIGEPPAIGINALTFGVAAVTWYLVRPSAGHRGHPAAPVGSPAVPRGGRATGLRFVWADRELRALSLLEVGTVLLGASVTSLFIYFVRTDLGEGEAMVGVLLTLASLGAVLAAVTTGRTRRRLGFRRAWLLCVGAQGLALALVGLADGVWAVAALAVLFAFGQIGAVVLATSFRQERTPDELLGRVTAAVLTLFLLAQAAGGVAGTSLADHLPTRDVFVTLGLLDLALLTAGWVLWRPRVDVHPNGQEEADPDGDHD